MKHGRIITTHRQDLILAIKDFYLGSKTQFLVIAYNQDLVDPSKFIESENFKLVPYNAKRPDGRLSIRQWKVWPMAAALFPEIDFWVVHDYDVLCKPGDLDIASHVKPDEYGMVGKPIPLWQEGMPETNLDNLPFPSNYRFWKKKLKTFPSQDIAEIEHFESVLKQSFPNRYDGVTTVLCGFGDFLATSAKNLSLLGDSRLASIQSGGIEQIPHSVFGHAGIRAVDLRQWYSMAISFDSTLSIPFKNNFDISHPVKYWPQGNKPGIKLKIKSLIKHLLRPGWKVVNKPLGQKSS